MIKSLLKNCSISIGKEYSVLSGEELKALIYLKIISNSNNSIFAVNLSTLSELMKVDKRSLTKYVINLESNNYITVDGDIKKYCNIKIAEENTFELLDSEFMLNTVNSLDGSELKLYCILTKFLNIKNNKNYIYPSMDTLVKEYYNELDFDNIDKSKLSNKKKNIEIIKNKLIEKGYIKKVAAYYFETHKGDLGKTTLGYFLKIGDNEVSSSEYFGFVEKQMEAYNENHKNVMKLASEKYLLKCKYKNIDRYVCYRDLTYDNSSNDEYEYYEPRNDYIRPRKKTLLEILKDK